jgi:hypothetical protein
LNIARRDVANGRCEIGASSLWSYAGQDQLLFQVENLPMSPGPTFEVWSGREDLNLRPPGPEPGALPGCATPRQVTESAQTGKARNLACRQGRQTQYAEIIAPSVILFLSSPFVRGFVLAGAPVVRYSPPQNAGDRTAFSRNLTIQQIQQQSTLVLTANSGKIACASSNAAKPQKTPNLTF